ncbi:MAG TPA: hypothetical protein PK131_02030 [Candidatus Woesebacteria bacterium]|nr:hypothetical protein [Candidatus Woesebacteria bacterium]HRS22768.1 hypothetical protein [Candidatus Woesebacteria bacterium]HRT40082.1 hypothetical protein [Candidatus Woesebacteria bacterium]
MAICNPLVDKNCSDIVSTAPDRASKLITGIISLIFGAAIIYFIFTLLMAGFSFINSGSDEKQLAAAKSQLTNAFIGLFVLLCVYALVALLEKIFGIQLLKVTLPTLT